MKLKEYCKQIHEWLFGQKNPTGLVIRDISELDKVMTPEKKEEAERAFLEFYPDGTKEVMCTSEQDGIDYLRQVDLKDFK